MTNQNPDRSLNRMARFVGTMFLLSLFTPMLNWVFVHSKVLEPGNAEESVRRVMGHEMLFRFGLVNDLVTSVIALLLAWSLYRLLGSIHRSLSQLALILKVAEGILLAAIALANFAALLVLKSPNFQNPGPFHQDHALLGAFFNTGMSLAAVPMMFLGLDFVIFLSLLMVSKYVPRTLAGFGVVSYALIFIYALLTLLFPTTAAHMILQVVCWAPSCLFEFIVGIWLLAKGIKFTPHASP